MMLDVAGVVLGAVLTCFVLSYILGDNFLYRLALHLFVGALVGYSFGLVLRDVLINMALARLLNSQLAQSERLAVVTPVILGILLLFKGFPKQAYIGNIPLAYLVGVGTAVALGGALVGTIVPQVWATGRALSPDAWQSYRLGPLDGLLIITGTICTLMSFSFIRQKGRGISGLWGKFVGLLATAGRVFLLFAFGTAFAGAVTASLSVFIGRVQYLIQTFNALYLRVMGF